MEKMDIAHYKDLSKLIKNIFYHNAFLKFKIQIAK